jgi:hypothetical protein
MPAQKGTGGEPPVPDYSLKLGLAAAALVAAGTATLVAAGAAAAATTLVAAGATAAPTVAVTSAATLAAVVVVIFVALPSSFRVLFTRAAAHSAIAVATAAATAAAAAATAVAIVATPAAAAAAIAVVIFVTLPPGLYMLFVGSTTHTAIVVVVVSTTHTAIVVVVVSTTISHCVDSFVPGAPCGIAGGGRIYPLRRVLRQYLGRIDQQ